MSENTKNEKIVVQIQKYLKNFDLEIQILEKIKVFAVDNCIDIDDNGKRNI